MVNRNTSFSRSPLSGGFTLIELMIVMAIIAMLAALVGPRLMNALSSSQVKTTKLQIETLSTSLESFRLDIGRYPTMQEGLAVLVTNTATPIPNWRGPYLKKKFIPKDAWGHEFIYEIPPKKGGMDFDLYSLGPDGKPGGEGDDADIGNWN
jgi:general secretion pathway protein G